MGEAKRRKAKMGAAYGQGHTPYTQKGRERFHALRSAWEEMCNVATQADSRGAVFVDGATNLFYWIPQDLVEKTFTDSGLDDVESLMNEIATYNPATEFVMLVVTERDGIIKLDLFGDASLDKDGWQDFANVKGMIHDAS